MSHPRWPGYNTKTGNPVYDNESRRRNQGMYRDVKRKFKLRGVVGRKRKKYLMRVEGGKYIALVNAVMNDLIREANANG